MKRDHSEASRRCCFLCEKKKGRKEGCQSECVKGSLQVENEAPSRRKTAGDFAEGVAHSAGEARTWRERPGILRERFRTLRESQGILRGKLRCSQNRLSILREVERRPREPQRISREPAQTNWTGAPARVPQGRWNLAGGANHRNTNKEDISPSGAAEFQRPAGARAWRGGVPVVSLALHHRLISGNPPGCLSTNRVMNSVSGRVSGTFTSTALPAASRAVRARVSGRAGRAARRSG